MKIAVVGTGVAGLVAAHRLHPRHEITVFEADDRIGGHVNTVDVELDGRHHAVDTGFIVYNERNYPGFVALLAEFDVATQPTAMSFGVSDAASGIEFRASNLNALFAQRRNLVKPSFLRLLTDIVRFNRAARSLIADEPPWTSTGRLVGNGRASDTTGDETLAQFVRRGRYSDAFVHQFLIPFGASIWSADPATFTEFPIRSYARFMHNHGLLEVTGQPQWRTITGGSARYVEALIASFATRIRVASPVNKIVRRIDDRAGVSVEVLSEHGSETFDRVVIATHSDQALRLLGDPTPDEHAVLGAIGYQRNVATLHTDESMLPTNPRARASWNYAVERGSHRSTVTYWMNQLQSIESTRPLLVTLNRRNAIADNQVLANFEYDHPVFDGPAIAAQRRRHEIQGERGVFFAGAYWGYGFHEDGVQSAHEVVAAIEGAP